LHGIEIYLYVMFGVVIDDYDLRCHATIGYVPA